MFLILFYVYCLVFIKSHRIQFMKNANVPKDHYLQLNYIVPSKTSSDDETSLRISIEFRLVKTLLIDKILKIFFRGTLMILLLLTFLN